jgi:hypothetical protein
MQIVMGSKMKQVTNLINLILMIQSIVVIVIFWSSEIAPLSLLFIGMIACMIASNIILNSTANIHKDIVSFSMIATTNFCLILEIAYIIASTVLPTMWVAIGCVLILLFFIEICYKYYKVK